MSEEITPPGDAVAMTPIGYQGPAAHTWTAGCDGSHPVAERCLAAVGTGNDQFVGSRGDEIVVQAPKARMTRAEALRHAAWLALVADPSGEEFARVLKAVRST